MVGARLKLFGSPNPVLNSQHRVMLGNLGFSAQSDGGGAGCRTLPAWLKG
jgi:hypothetical protein